MSAILEVQDLKVYFERGESSAFHKKTIRALDGVSFRVKRGETLGIVGESGCGKTTLGKTVLGLLKPTSGRVFYEGQELTGLKGRKFLPYRKKMQMIFQDPYSSLNPRMTIRDIIAEGLKAQGAGNGRMMDGTIRELLGAVGLDGSYLYRYPGDLSGGQRQRVGIARAFAVEPELIVCDEPISALDVSIRAQIVNTLKDLQEMKRMTYLFIAHDLAVVRYISDRIAILYQGNLMELGETETIFRDRMHPYTQVLLSSVLAPDPRKKADFLKFSVEGDSLSREGEGCPFYPRCKERTEICRIEKPALFKAGEGHFCACHKRVPQ